MLYNVAACMLRCTECDCLYVMCYIVQNVTAQLVGCIVQYVNACCALCCTQNVTACMLYLCSVSKMSHW